MSDQPLWERRVRAPQLTSFSLLGPPISWADDAADRGVLLANPTGRTEVFAFDAATTPAALTQITDRAQGTMGAAVSPDGSTIFWFDDGKKWIIRDGRTGISWTGAGAPRASGRKKSLGLRICVSGGVSAGVVGSGPGIWPPRP